MKPKITAAPMTKAITSIAALRFVDAGRVRLDDEMSHYLPELGDRLVHLGRGPGPQGAGCRSGMFVDKRAIGLGRRREISCGLPLDSGVVEGFRRPLVAGEFGGRPEIGLGGLRMFLALGELFAGLENRLDDQYP